MTNKEIIELSDRYLFRVYPRAPIAIVRGKGCRVWDGDGKAYLDFFASTVVAALGHAHPAITAALTQQAEKVLQVSNLHYSEPAALLAQQLCEHSFADRIFFCNSGAEANEAAIKLARRYGSELGGGRFEILTATGSFHGRTLATIVATGQEKVRRGFQPLPEGFRYVPYDDVAALEAAIGERTIAVMLEPLQGEGGVLAPAPDYLAHVRELCDRYDLLLVLDEVQTGMGRLGTLFGYQHSDVSPDVMTLAKGLGSGVPIGAMLATERVAAAFEVGSHGSTFGGNSLTCAVGLAVVDALVRGGVLDNCREVGAYLRAALEGLRQRFPIIREVRGQGLLLGAVLSEPGGPIVDRCREAGLLINCTAEKVLRFSPPLIVTRAEVDECIDILSKVLGQ